MPLTRLAAAAALALLAVPSPAVADPVPTPVAYATGGQQRGWLAHSAAFSQSGRNACVGFMATGTGQHPPPVRHDAAKALAVRVARADRPALVRATVWQTAAGSSVGATTTPPVTLRPVRDRSRVVAWDAVFSVQPGDQHVAFDVRWREGPCGADEGSWRFRLLALPVA